MRRKVFIDCGGYDGCSIVKFLLMRPDYLCFTFEPNRQFKNFYKFLPTRLIQKAVANFDGEVDFLIDPIDGDGSSIVPAKKVDAKGIVTNEQCVSERVACVDLGGFILENTFESDYLVLKLDVEGAEYAILDDLLNTGLISRVGELYCEFHWGKMGVSQAEHEVLFERLRRAVKIKPWDAHSHAVYSRGEFRWVLRVWHICNIIVRRGMRRLVAR